MVLVASLQSAAQAHVEQQGADVSGTSEDPWPGWNPITRKQVPVCVGWGEGGWVWERGEGSLCVWCLCVIAWAQGRREVTERVATRECNRETPQASAIVMERVATST